MNLGRSLHRLWRHRLAFALSLATATLAALWSVAEIGVLPPRLEARPLEIASASAGALVDTPQSAVVSLDVDTVDLSSITNRALLISNVMASAPVREYIARRARVPASVIEIQSPVTPDWPRPLSRPGDSRGALDIAKYPGEYRISLQNNPTVPVVEVYAVAPTPAIAARLANGAIEGTQDYLRALGARQDVPAAEQVRLQQLGRATAGSINSGADVKVAVLSFVVVFAACSAASLFVVRVVRGWRLAALATSPTASPHG